MINEAPPTLYPTGNGNILCGACGKPLAFHSMLLACPVWTAGVVSDKENYNKQSARWGRSHGHKTRRKS